MDTKSQRDLYVISPTSTIPEIIGALKKALSGQGPAIGFGEIESRSVTSEICLVIATSGTGGVVKEVGLAASALRASTQAANKFVKAEFGQIWSLLLPLNHIAGVNILLRSLELGTTPINLNSCSDAQYPEADFTAIVPTQLFRALSGDDRLLQHLQSTKAVLVGGSFLSAELKAQGEKSGIKIISTYGMTETSGGCVYNGKSLEGVEVAISDNGLVKIRGPVIASTYVNNSELWKKTFLDGWFITSDNGELVDGSLVISGRADDVVISGGENISLGAIEETLLTKFPTTQFAAFAIKDAQWGESLQLAVVGNISNLEIESLLEEKLGSAAKPKTIHHLEKIPLTGIGKVDRVALMNLVAHE